jgi:periplasmic protein TonB
VTFNFVETFQRESSRLPVSLALPISWKRFFAIVLVTILACLLHCLLMFWYTNRPAPMPISEAKALTMMDIALEAPMSGAIAEKPPEQSKLIPPTPKPKLNRPKPKPKPIKKKAKAEIKKPIPKPEPEAAQPESQAQVSPVKEQSNRPVTAGTNPNSQSQTSQVSKTTQARGYAGYLSNPKPNYPSLARSRHWEGLVLLRVYVTPDGRCGSINVNRSSGHDVLDESALTAVRNWKFIPGKRGDTPIASWVTVPIQFMLRD